MIRRALFRAWRVGEALVATSLVWIPSLVLTGAGAIYLYQAYHALTAPGLKIQVVYAGSGGNFSIAADSYAIYPFDRRVVIFNARLTGPLGEGIARMGLVEAKWESGAIVVFARNGSVNVVRRADRTFALTGALPAQESASEPSIVEVHAENIGWHYTDRSLPRAPVLRGTVPYANVVALGSQASFGAALVAQGNDPVTLSGSIADGGNFFATAKWPEGNFVWVIPHLSGWVSREDAAYVKEVSARTLRTAGRFMIASQESRLDFGGQGSLAGTGIRYADVLRDARLDGSWRVTTTGLATNMRSREPNRAATFDGYVDWRAQPRVAGKTTATADTARRFWSPLAKVVPKDLSLKNPQFAGQVLWAGQKFAVNGTVKATQLAYGGETVTGVTANTSLTENGLVVAVRSARYQDAAVQGGLSLNFRSNRLSGGIASNGKIALGAFARRYGVPGITGQANVNVAVGGSIQKPTFVVDMNGTAQYKPEGNPRVDLGKFQARASAANSLVDIQRLFVFGGSGAASATGRVNTRTKQLDLALVAGGVLLEKFSTEVSGVGLARGRVTGPWTNPQFAGTAQGFGITYQQQVLPELSAALRVNREGLMAEHWVARRGTSNAEGTFAMDFKTQAIRGQFDADQVQLSEFWESPAVDASIKISQGTLQGTVSNPLVSAIVDANAIALQRADLDSAHAKVSLRGKLLSIENGIMNFGDGTGTVFGSYDLESKSGSAVANLHDAELDIQALTGGDLPARGVFSGDAKVTLRDGQVSNGTSKVMVKDVRIADEPIGAGTVEASVSNGIWTGRADFGTQNRFVVAEQLRYDPKSKAIGGSIDVLNVPIAEWLGSNAIAKLSKWDDETRALTRKFSGDATAHLELGGTTEALTLSMPTLAIEKFKIGTREAGVIDVAAYVDAGNLRVEKLTWISGDTNVRFVGARGQDGELSGEASVNKFDLGWLNAFDPSLPAISAIASGVFDLSGTIEDPRVRGSANAQQITHGDSPTASLSLDEIILNKKVFTARGVFGAEAFSGDVNAVVPLSAFRGHDPSAQPIRATFDLHPRKVKDLDAFLPSLDKARSSGTIAGSVQLFGTIIDLDLTGKLALTDANLAIEGVDTMFAVPSLTATWERNRMRLIGAATGSNGGSVEVDMIATVPNLFSSESSLDTALGEANLDRFNLNVNDLVIREQQANKDKRYSVRIAPTQIRGTGKLANPTLSGSIHLADLDAAIPEAAAESSVTSLPINPLFNAITLQLDNPARIRTSTTNLLIDGGGQIDGSLESPKATALLRLVEGIFQLPNARIVLEEGGTLKFRYDSALDIQNSARLDLDLEGRTAITARRFADTLERYDISLRITGNLLENGGLKLDASSDPPDLSSQEILAALGQRDLIESLARGGGRSQNGLTNAALSLAVPGLTSRFTQGVASAFKLDYLSVEYNAFEQASIAAAKTLGKGLTLTMRRQLQERPGQRTRYEVKLTYRLPSRNKLLSRVRIGVGFDQDRPWKLTLEYFKRF